MQGNRFDIQADTQNENKTQLVPQALHRNNYCFLAIYLDVRGLAYVSIIFCGVSLLINKDGNINL